jgi:hypothetical protein
MDILVDLRGLLSAENTLEAVRNLAAMIQESMCESCRIDGDWQGRWTCENCEVSGTQGRLTEDAVNQDVPGSKADSCQDG